MIETKIKKWGNSLAVRLPLELADQMFLREDSLVELSLGNHQLSIKLVAKKGGRLEELVSKINNHNSQAVVDWGRPVGRELW